MRLEEPALWWIAQDFTGPDDVDRTREGLAASIEATPYSEGKVLPHELTHAGPKEGRLRLLRATRTQLEPIFLLYDADALAARPDGDPEMDVDEGGVRTQVWRLPGGRDRARRAAADRRRPPPLRDRRRLPRGGPVRDAHVRRARLVAFARASRSFPRTGSPARDRRPSRTDS